MTLEIIPSLAAFAPGSHCAVIVNCGTKWATTLAVVSAHRHVGWPLLVIDCQSTDGSYMHFQDLAAQHDIHIYWLEWPLRPHPIALDQLFQQIAAELVLLIDSDLEIATLQVVDAMTKVLEGSDRAYGAGFLHGPNWIGSEHGLHDHAAYYAERMWIPCVMLRTEHVRAEIRAGGTFLNRRLFQEIPRMPRLSRLLGYHYSIRGLRGFAIRTPAALGSGVEVEGRRPSFIEYDTGADLHAALKRRGRPFIPLPTHLWGDVHHYHGVTRAQHSRFPRRLLKAVRLATTETETAQDAVLTDIKRRLEERYGVVTS